MRQLAQAFLQPERFLQAFVVVPPPFHSGFLDTLTPDHTPLQFTVAGIQFRFVRWLRVSLSRFRSDPCRRQMRWISTVGLMTSVKKPARACSVHVLPSNPFRAAMHPLVNAGDFERLQPEGSTGQARPNASAGCKFAADSCFRYLRNPIA